MLDLPVLGNYKIFLTQAALVFFSKEASSVHFDQFIGELMLSSFIRCKSCVENCLLDFKPIHCIQQRFIDLINFNVVVQSINKSPRILINITVLEQNFNPLCISM